MHAIEVEQKRLLKRIRIALAIFMCGLVVSGLTAFPLRAEANIAARLLHESWLEPVAPQRGSLHAKIALLIDVAEVAALAFALRAGDWIVIAPALAGNSHFSAEADSLNRLLIIGCYLALVFRTIQLVYKSVRYWHAWAAKTGVQA